MEEGITLKKEQCKKQNCKHIWYPRKEKPLMCPKCKSLYWDKTSKRK